MTVIKGYVKRYKIGNDGSLGVQIVYGPQDVFSLTKAYRLLLDQSLYDGPEVYYYSAMSDAQLYCLEGEAFATAVGENPMIYRELFSEAGHHLKTCVHSIENISLPNAYARVAHQLLFFAKEFGERTPEGISPRMPLTHQDIADILGITRETATMSIIKLRKEGLISNDRQFSVLDFEGLEEAAYQ